MASPNAPQFPTSGGSYTRKPTGSLDKVDATKPPPAVQPNKPETAPTAAPPAAKGKKE